MSVIRHPSTGTAVTVKQWRYTATGGETTLSGTDGFGLSLSYTVGAEEVYINGVLLVRGTDYTASTGTSITGLTALVTGDVATVMSANSFNVANAIAASTVTAKGDLIVANGASSVSNLAVGADGTTLVADSSRATGLKWAAATDVTKIPLSTVTAAGDLIVGTGSATVTNLAIGANGTYLTSNGTTASWGTVSAGGMTLLASGSLSGATTISSIPGGYKGLNLRLYGPIVSGGNPSNMRFNNDTSSSYYGNYINTTSSTVNTFSSQNSFPYIGGGGATASYYEVSIPNYTSTTASKYIFAPSAGSVNNGGITWGFWNNQSAINQINLPQSYTGGSYELYGVK